MIKDLAPNITRKRLLLEGFYKIDTDKETIQDFFDFIAKELNVRTYSDPIIFETGNKGKKENQGYDAFVPLIDSGDLVLCMGKYEVHFNYYLYMQRF